MKRAFTLIELLVVISVISLLASVVLASLNTAREKGRMAAIKQFVAQAEHIAGEQAIGIWDFDECSGTSVTAERSGLANAGSLANFATSTWSADSPSGIGCSIALNGTNQYVNAGNPAALNLGATEDMTLSVWIKTTTTNNVWIVDKKYAGTNNAGFDLNSQGGGLYFRIANGVTQGGVTMSGAIINDGKWHNIVAIISRADSYLYLYIDGVLNRKASFTNTWNLSGSDSFVIGAYGVGGGGFFPGSIDSVRVFNKTLTAEQVGKLYAANAVKYNVAIK